MSLTIWNWVFVICLAIVGIVATICIGGHYYNDEYHGYSGKKGSWSNYHKYRLLGFLISGVISIVIILGTMFGLNWYNTQTASGKRNYKDFKSEINNGIYREITITNNDGKVIYDYTGKCDIQEQGGVDERKLKFENEQGKRVIIYYGITDTVKIIEKDKEKSEE